MHGRWHTRPGVWTFVAATVIATAVAAAYANTLHVPFLFDDFASIVRNRTIRHLTSLADVLNPPAGGQGVTGRPIVNLSLACNYALSGTSVVSYHVANAMLHFLAAVLLFGLVRRTFRASRFGTDLQAAADPLALCVALIWVLHPLQTESVTCVIQRTEVLVGLFYLLTLFAFTRAATGGHRAWLWVSVLACAIGMATKEVMVTAPLLVLAFDRTFFSPTFRAAMRTRRWFYSGLFSTWIVLALLLVQIGGSRGTAAGFKSGISSWNYLLTQAEALVRYVGLALWPTPLVLDYGAPVVDSLQAVILPGLLVLVALAAATRGFWHRSAAGFAGLSFFVILAPSSSVVPLAAQTMAEHRMYLPLAPLIAIAVVGLFRSLGRWSWLAVTCLCLGLGLVTAARNHVYLTPLGIWSDTVAKRPDNPRALTNLGNSLAEVGLFQAAIDQYTTALKLDPGSADTHADLAGVLLKTGRAAEAAAHCRAALDVEPNHAAALNNLSALTSDPKAAIAYAERALQAQPEFPEAHVNLGVALVQAGETARGQAELETALRLRPDAPNAHYALGVIKLQSGDLDGAKAEFQAAVRGSLPYPDAEDALGTVLLRTGELSEATAHFRRACEQRPTSAQFQGNYAAALLQAGDAAGALAHFQLAVQHAPNDLRARLNLGAAYFQLKRYAEAAEAYRSALRLAPDSAEVQGFLARAQQAQRDAERATPAAAQ